MDEAMQVITCVSTVPNEGKSTIACNLARIMAAKYKNVYKTLYLIFDYPYKYYTFKHFEV